MELSGPDSDALRERRRRKREWTIVGILAVVIPVVFYLEHRYAPLPIPGSAQILFFSLVNLDALLIVLMLFLVLRNVYKLIIERRTGVLGSSLRTKIVLAFVGLSFIPMAVLLYIASDFVRLSVQMWFGREVERTLAEAMDVAQTYYASVVDQAETAAQEVAQDVSEAYPAGDAPLAEVHERLSSRLKRHGLYAIELRMADGRSITRVDVEQDTPYLETPEDLWAQAAAGENVHQLLPFQDRQQEMVKAVAPIGAPGGGTVGAVAVSLVLPRNLVNKIHEAERTYREFLSMQSMRVPLNRLQQQTILVIIGLLSLFAASWIGFYLSGWLTVPIRELSRATRRLAAGELGFTVNLKRGDEMGILLESFNRMSSDLKRKTDEIEAANREVRRRAADMEAILASVASGVMTLDARGKVVTVNRSLARVFDVDTAGVAGRTYHEVFPDLARPLSDMIRGAEAGSREAPEGEVVSRTAQGVRCFRVVVTRLLGEREGHPAEGDAHWVVVFDDVSDLIRAQKETAWREVAKRLGHEIKNPLTPIQLSAQRLRKRYPQLLEDGKGTFDECTRTIISQVDEMKGLVNALTDLARIPAYQPVECDLGALVDEVLPLYRQAHPAIEFGLRRNGAQAIIADRSQLRQALINLLDNAVTALGGKQGRVEVRTRLEEDARTATLTVSDTGPGVPAEILERIFEPYFSYGKKGMGLGLAIVQRIVDDHGGSIRVGANLPHGAVFRISLPVGK
ncbi:MAG: HAMP domain-containing protein [Nitrospirae bacterium]|nr:HAMP domain-containing protein [Nitrospirota bacterium]